MLFLERRSPAKLGESTPKVSPVLIWNKNIQIIRGIAVILVVISHFAHIPLLGTYGVDLFFIISGYLISSILTAEFRKTGRIDVKEFLIKRAKRLVPAAYLAIASILVLSVAGFLPGSVNDYMTLGLGYCLYIGNIFGLLPGSASTTALGLGHFWTLATEMQLYFFWCILFIPMLLKFRYRSRLYFLGIILVVLFPLTVFITSEMSQTIVQRSIEVATMFTLGTIYYFLHERFDFRRKRILLAFIGIILILNIPGPFSINPSNKVANIYTNIILVGLAFQVLFSARLASWTKFITYIGDFSYSLYLLHWPIYLVVGGHEANVFELACGLITSIGLSILSFQFVERLFWKPNRI